MGERKLSERTLLEMAKGREVASRHTRWARLEEWEREGKVRTVTRFAENERLLVVGYEVVCGDETFFDAKDSYPSEELLARLFLKLEFDRQGTCVHEWVWVDRLTGNQCAKCGKKSHG